jgi:hypothetical protein
MTFEEKMFVSYKNKMYKSLCMKYKNHKGGAGPDDIITDTVQDLPEDLLRHIASFVRRRRDLKKLRLASPIFHKEIPPPPRKESKLFSPITLEDEKQFKYLESNYEKNILNQITKKISFIFYTSRKIKKVKILITI